MEEFGDGVYLNPFVEDDFVIVPIVDDEHGRVSAFVDVVCFEIVHVALVAAHVDPRVVVLFHIFFPAIEVGIVGDGIDVEVAGSLQFEGVVEFA